MRNIFYTNKRNIPIVFMIFKHWTVFSKDIDIALLGFKRDGITIRILKIQLAIDSCSDTGGGKVIIPTEIFLYRTIYLVSARKRLIFVLGMVFF